MGFQYVAYNLLEKYIKESIATELKHHKIDEKDLKKGLGVLHSTHSERAKQCKFLLAVIGKLNQSESDDKTCILNAAAFYIRNQIIESYTYILTSIFTTPENSNLFNSLTTSLSLTKDNLPSLKDLQNMYCTLERFMKAHVYKDSDPRNGYLKTSLQIFSRRKIKDYDVEVTLADLLKKITKLQLKQMKLAKEEQLTKAPDKKSATQSFGLFVEKPSSDMVSSSTSSEEQIAANPGM